MWGKAFSASLAPADPRVPLPAGVSLLVASPLLAACGVSDYLVRKTQHSLFLSEAISYVFLWQAADPHQTSQNVILFIFLSLLTNSVQVAS